MEINVAHSDIFISCARVDSPHATALIRELRRKEFHVAHSPREPLDGHDESWHNWYEGRGQSTIAATEIFVVVVTEAWDCSTWMAFEATEALKSLEQGTLKRMLHYNPTHIEVHYPENKWHWLGEKLPNELDEAVAIIETIAHEPSS